jgi:iron complex outermembrane recepter protein
LEANKDEFDSYDTYNTTHPYNKSYSASNAATATKTDVPIMETPVSVQVVTKALMDDLQTVRLKDALKYVSGVSSYNPAGSFDYDNFVIRGFYDYYLTSIYRNGLQTRRAAFDTANIERLEVLKGPSSVLYGRTEPGGMINRVTKTPLDIAYYAISQQFASFDHYRTTLDLTGPIDDEKRLLYRFNMAYQQADTYVDINHQERIFVAPSLTWRIQPGTEIFMNAEYKRDRQRYYDGIPILDTLGNHDRPAPIRPDTFLGFGGNNEFETLENAVAEIGFKHQLTDNWKLQGRYHHQWFNYLFNTYYSNGMVDAAHIERGTYYEPYDVTNVDQANIEVVGKVTGAGEHNLLLGFDWHRYTDRIINYCCDTPGSGKLVDIYHPTYVDYPNVVPNSYYTNDERWYGLYGQDQITLFNDWHILLGGRYDWASKSNSSSSTSFDNMTTNKLDEGAFSPRVGVVYDLSDEFSAYTSYSRSFSINNGKGFGGAPLPSQTAEQWEVGLKMQALNGSLNGSLALYDLTKRHLSGPDPQHRGFNAALGEARSRGIELDLNARVSEHWNLIGTYSYTDAILTKNDEGNEGNRLIAVPKHMGSLWIKYNFVPDGLTGLGLAVGTSFASQREVNYANTAQLPGYGRLDMAASYRWKFSKQTLSANFNVDNLLDKSYFENGGYGTAGVFPGAPRTFTGMIKLEY